MVIYSIEKNEIDDYWATLNLATTLKIGEPGYFTLGARTDNGEVTGSLQFQIYENPDNDETEARILHLYVIPEYRDQKAGTTLMTEMEDILYKSDVKTVRMYASVEDDIFPAYLENYGFELEEDNEYSCFTVGDFQEYGPSISVIAAKCTGLGAMDANELGKTFADLSKDELNRILTFDKMLSCVTDAKDNTSAFMFVRRDREKVILYPRCADMGKIDKNVAKKLLAFVVDALLTGGETDAVIMVPHADKAVCSNLCGSFKGIEERHTVDASLKVREIEEYEEDDEEEEE